MDARIKDRWRDLLLPFGKEPADVRVVSAEGYPATDTDALDRDGPRFSLNAMRVDGVFAASFAEPVMDITVGSIPAWESFFRYDWREMDGRSVYAATLTPAGWEQLGEVTGFEPVDAGSDEFGVYVYPKGEVLFVLMMPPDGRASGLPSVGDILSELP